MHQELLEDELELVSGAALNRVLRQAIDSAQDLADLARQLVDPVH